MPGPENHGARREDGQALAALGCRVCNGRDEPRTTWEQGWIGRDRGLAGRHSSRPRVDAALLPKLRVRSGLSWPVEPSDPTGRMRRGGARLDMRRSVMPQARFGVTPEAAD